MRRRITNIKLGMISGPFLLLILAFGLAWASGDDLYSLIRLFDRIAIAVSDKYVEPINNERLIKAGIAGMMERLDPYSRYLAESDYFYLLQETQGEYGGVGIELEKAGDSVRVSSVIQKSPASKANIKVGDRLIGIDTVAITGKSVPDCRKLLRGENGTTVSLRFWRPFSSREFTLEIVRDEIHIEAVPCWFIDRYNNGYIKISRFSEGCLREVKSAITALKENNINGLIIDLRDNPGGLLYESVEVAALFLDQGDEIVETRSRGEAIVQMYNALEDGAYKKLPIVVLINDQTASAAEIVAGAIQDNDRGILIGSTTFGKGLVQQIMKLSDHSALKLTTAKYYTPSDRCIQKNKNTTELSDQTNGDKELLFYTKSGRPVFGGGGIIPDIYIEPAGYPPLIDEIITLGYVDEFVAEQSKSKNVDEKFAVDDELIDEFMGFLHDKDYVFHNRAYRKLSEFRESLPDLDYRNHLDEPLAEIEGVLQEAAHEELESSKSVIKDVLYDHFITANLGEKMACQWARQYTDPAIAKAGEVLKNPGDYNGLLVGY